MTDRDWISTREAAEILGVSQRTIQNWVDIGRIDSSKTMGGHRRISPESIEKLAPDRRIEKKSIGRDERLRVLVVEDDASLQMLYKLKLGTSEVPMDLVIAGSGYRGLVLMGKMTPHVLITDLRMPGMDGFELINQVRQMEEFRDTRIIVVSGLSSQEIIARGGLPEGVVLQPKPVSFDVIEAVLHQTDASLRRVAAHD